VNVDKQFLFVVNVCKFFWDSLNFKFFQMTINYEHGQYKKQEIHAYVEGNTYSWKEMCEVMFFVVKEAIEWAKFQAMEAKLDCIFSCYFTWWDVPTIICSCIVC